MIEDIISKAKMIVEWFSICKSYAQFSDKNIVHKNHQAKIYQILRINSASNKDQKQPLRGAL